MCQGLMSRWKYQFSLDHRSQTFWAQPIFKMDTTFWELMSAAVMYGKQYVNEEPYCIVDQIDWCQDGITSSRTITEVKNCELSQFSNG